MNLACVTPFEVRSMTDDLHVLLQDKFRLLHTSCGANDQFECYGWRLGQSLPDEDKLERLVLVYEVLMAFVYQYGSERARTWFAEGRCDDGMLVHEAVRVANFDAFRQAAAEAGVSLQDD